MQWGPLTHPGPIQCEEVSRWVLATVLCVGGPKGTYWFLYLLLRRRPQDKADSLPWVVRAPGDPAGDMRGKDRAGGE